MKPEYVNYNVRARCPDCSGAVTTFEFRNEGNECGYILIDKSHQYAGKNYSRIVYRLMRCAGCARGGLAKIHDNGQSGDLESFFPTCIENAPLPEKVPKDIEDEYREAELCISFSAWRAASAMLRSTLEKTLKTNGYTNGTLEKKIDETANDGIITETRRNKAHEDIRVLGNDVLHEDWRTIDEKEVAASHHYVQRILEDFYDDRDTVEKKLLTQGRLKKT